MAAAEKAKMLAPRPPEPAKRAHALLPSRTPIIPIRPTSKIEIGESSKAGTTVERARTSILLQHRVGNLRASQILHEHAAPPAAQPPAAPATGSVASGMDYVKRSAAGQKSLEGAASPAQATQPAPFPFDSPSVSPTFALIPKNLPAAPPASTDTPAHSKEPARKDREESAGAGKKDEATVPAAATQMDDRYQNVLLRLSGLAKTERSHQPLTVKMAQAQKATRQPEIEPEAEGKRTHIHQMKAASEDRGAPPQVREKTFAETLERALATLVPQSVDDMKDLAENPERKEGVRGAIHSSAEQQAGQSKEHLQLVSSTPAPLGNIEKGHKALSPLAARAKPAEIGAKDVLPLPKPDSEVSYDDDQKEAQSAVDKTTLTEDELRDSNEPTFQRVLDERDKIVETCKADAARYHQGEADYLKTASFKVATQENKTRGGMRAFSTRKHAHVHQQQTDLAKKNEDERNRIAGAMKLNYLAAKIVVDARLQALPARVDEMFTRSFNVLFSLLQQDVQDDMEAFADRRHSGIKGIYYFWKDTFGNIANLDDAKTIYQNAKNRFEKSMKKVFNRIAGMVDDTLTECKSTIDAAEHRNEEMVNAQRDPNLKAFVATTSEDIKNQFGDLRQTIEDTKKDLATELANRYKESRETLDKWVEKDKESHRGMLKKVGDWAVGVYDTIVEIKNKLFSILKRGWELIKAIVRHPIRFFGHLWDALKQGLHQFKENIKDHLKEAALSWLFGAIPSSELHLPKDFSPASIFGFVMEVLRFTPAYLRSKIRRLVGSYGAAVLEHVMGFFAKYFEEGPAALWEEIQSQASELKTTIVEGVRDWVLAQIIKKGIEHLLMLFTPASAFIEACLAIYHLIVFFFERASQIGEMLSGILDSLEAIVAGKIDSAAKRIEDSMTRAISLILGFLSSLFGIPSPVSAIRKIVTALHEKVDKAIDWLIDKFKAIAMKAGRAIVTTVSTVGSKLGALFFPKKYFDVDGEKHFVEAIHSGDEYPILVHSEEKSLESIIQEAEANKVKGAAKLRKAYDEYRSVHVKQVSISDKDEREAKWNEIQKTGEAKLKAYQKVADLIEEVYPRLPSSKAKKKKIETVVHYGPTERALGSTYMIAHPLTHESWDKGTGTDADHPPIMKDSSWPTKRKKLYRRGHLLNRLLGGPGKEDRNLTPLTASANALHNTKIEKFVKQLTKPVGPSIFHYEVHVNYPASPRKPDPATQASKAEGEFAISLTAKWYELEPSGSGFTEKEGSSDKGEATVPNVPPYPS
jgi:hypothetical protein